MLPPVKDAIIKELVALVSSKKGEVAGLREQLKALQAQLAAMVAERSAHEDRVRILADKINVLNLQRQKEFQKWQVGAGAGWLRACVLCLRLRLQCEAG